MNREIKFRAWVPSIKTMLCDISIYPDGMIGIDEDDFKEQLNPAYEFDGEHVRTKISEDGESGYDYVLTLNTGEDWVWIDKDEYDLMQYTGLKDKNGKEIYEGDIVKCWDDSAITKKYEWGLDKIHVGVIKYNPPHFSLVIEDIQLIHWSSAENIEIIGNIYENPELLKQ